MKYADPLAQKRIDELEAENRRLKFILNLLRTAFMKGIEHGRTSRS